MKHGELDSLALASQLESSDGEHQTTGHMFLMNRDSVF